MDTLLIQRGFLGIERERKERDLWMERKRELGIDREKKERET